MVARTPEMLNHFLRKLVGPTCQELIVKNREKIGWDPRKLLKDIMRVYLQFDGIEPFMRATAERGFTEQEFMKAASIATKRHLLRSSDIEAFRTMTQRCVQLVSPCS